MGLGSNLNCSIVWVIMGWWGYPQNAGVLVVLVHTEDSALVAYGSGKRMVTGTRAGSRIKTENFKRRLLPYHTSQRRDIWCKNSPATSCFNPRFVDRSVPCEAKQRRVKFQRCFGNIPLAAGNVSVMNIQKFRYRTKSSGNRLPEPWFW